MKMFYIWIKMRCYFASLSINIFVFFTRYSAVRYFIFVFEIIYSILSTKCMAFAFAFAQN